MDSFEKYFTISLRFLSYRPRSEKEVRDNLIKKKADLQLIEKIIQDLKKRKFLNDLDFAIWWVEQRSKVKSQGKRLISLELQRKGITKDIIEEVFSTAEEAVPEIEKAQKIVEKKISKYKGLPRHEIYQKLGGMLARRGFDFDTIKHAIDEVLQKGV